VSASEPGLGEQIVQLFEEAAEKETEEMVANKQPLATVLKDLDIGGKLEAGPSSAELYFDDPLEYKHSVQKLFDPENLHTLATKGWVPAKSGDLAMSFEPADMLISFIEIATNDPSDKDEAPELEKILKDAQKFAATEPEHDEDMNPVEFDDKTSDDHKKGVGKEAEGKQPEGTPKGSKKTSESILHELGGHWCKSCQKATSAKYVGNKACCAHCGGDLAYPKSSSLRSREFYKANPGSKSTPKDVAESLLEMTSAGAIPAIDGPPPVPAAQPKVDWNKRLERMRKRRGDSRGKR